MKRIHFFFLSLFFLCSSCFLFSMKPCVDVDVDDEACELVFFEEPDDAEDDRTCDLIAIFVRHLLRERKELKRLYDKARQRVKDAKAKWDEDVGNARRERLYSLAITRLRSVEWDWFVAGQSPVYQRLGTKEERIERLLDKTCCYEKSEDQDLSF